MLIRNVFCKTKADAETLSSTTEGSQIIESTDPDYFPACMMAGKNPATNDTPYVVQWEEESDEAN